MNITIIGTGYVGLVAGACFAEIGHQVVCVDIAEEKINTLNRGEIPIYEPGLEVMVKRNSREGRLSFTTNLPTAVKQSKAIFIAVGTPTAEGGNVELKYVLKVAENIAHNMNGYKVIVDKSTVPVGTAGKVEEIIGSISSEDFDVVSNPEFLKEGAAIDDFLKPDRVIIGVDSSKAKEVMEELYEPFLRNNHPIIFMDVKSAEMTKYAANAMLATKISFINEIANLCDKVGADASLVRKGIGSDTRIGYSFLYPGMGYGGSCFPKDVKALIQTAKDHDLDFSLLQAVEAVNQKQKTCLLDKIKTHYRGDFKNKTFAIWGLSFKPKTDDIREAPSLALIEELLKRGCRIKANDPEAINEVKNVLGDKIEYYHDRYECLKNCDGLILCTEWLEYQVPDFSILKKSLKDKVIFDGRNIYLKTAKKAGFNYYCVGSNIPV